VFGDFYFAIPWRQSIGNMKHIARNFQLAPRNMQQKLASEARALHYQLILFVKP